MEAGQTSVQAPQPTQDLPITGSFPMSLMAPSSGSTLQTSRQSSQSFPTWADNFSLGFDTVNVFFTNFGVFVI